MDINDCNDVISINLIALEVDIAFAKFMFQIENKNNMKYNSQNVYSLLS